MITFATIYSLLVISSPVMSECGDSRIRDIVAQIENATTSDLDKLVSTNPMEAAGCLVGQLHVVERTSLSPQEFDKQARALRVVWSIRALRYITGGKDVVAHLSPELILKLDAKRKEFLTDRRSDAIPFFAVWMSRDIIYFAPRQAQEDIIAVWHRWYQTEGTTFEYRRATSMEDWYF